MPDAADIASVFGFKFIFENALKTVLSTNEVNAFTTQAIERTGDETVDAENEAAGYQLLDFQRDRPRAEIDFTPGAGVGRWHPLPVNGVKFSVESAWGGTYRVLVVTKPDIREHNAMVNAIRFLMLTMGARINDPATLPKHHIAPQFKDSGSTPTTKAEDGSFTTILAYDINFSIQSNAWTALET